MQRRHLQCVTLSANKCTPSSCSPNTNSVPSSRWAKYGYLVARGRSSTIVGGRENLFKKILATAETRKEELHCGGWDTEVIKRRLKNQTMLDKKREREEAEESESA